jgi:GAF domain-containing protein
MTSRDAEDFATMALSLHDEPTLDETVDRVLQYAMKAVVCSYAGVIFVHGKSRVETVAATNPIVAELDLVQLEHGEGPDLDVLTHPADTVIVEDTQREERWPGWAKAVAGAGVRSMLGTRLHTSSTTIGSLNLYDERPGHFTEEDGDVAHIFARHAAVALSAARVNANLWRAIDARQLIGQAQGILMERFAIDPDQAFAVLRRYSQDRNLKLHVVAERLIATRRLPE